jgi:class 3 adenylate cyclase
MSSRVLTVMFTDIKGFTERTSKSSRAELDHILEEHEHLLMPLIPEFEGRLIKTVGDALMIVFDSPTNAVLCGIMMQERLHERNKDLPEGERLEVRVAINTGEMLEREGDVFGEAVNIAARIEGITEASEIYFTESVYLAMNKAEVPSSELGLRRLKGVPEPIKIYRVIRDRLQRVHPPPGTASEGQFRGRARAHGGRSPAFEIRGPGPFQARNPDQCSRHSHGGRRGDPPPPGGGLHAWQEK